MTEIRSLRASCPGRCRSALFRRGLCAQHGGGPNLAWLVPVETAACVPCSLVRRRPLCATLRRWVPVSIFGSTAGAFETDRARNRVCRIVEESGHGVGLRSGWKAGLGPNAEATTR